MSRLRQWSYAGDAGAALITASAGGVFVVDPTQLPEATSPGQTRHATNTYGRGLAAGQKYNDPLSDAPVLKVTSATVPTANSGVNGGYATSGPRISQPWVGGDGKTYLTRVLDFVSQFYDLDYEAHAAVNFRSAGDAAGPGDAGMAFSLDPSTPRISYYIDGAVIRRYDTATGADAPSGIFPYTVAVGSGSLNWLQTQLNDTWMAFMRGTEYMALRTSDATLRRASTTRTGLGHDELHLDLLNPIVYLSVDDDASANATWDLENDTIELTPDGVEAMSDDHCDRGWGYVVGTAHFQVGGGMYTHRGDVNQTTQPITTTQGYHDASADFYTSAAWCMNLPTGATLPEHLWHLTSKEFQDDADAKIRRYALALVKNDGSSVRIAGHHDSIGADLYNSYSKACLSPDGFWLFFCSDMNGSGRFDEFVMKLPTVAV